MKNAWVMRKEYTADHLNQLFPEKHLTMLILSYLLLIDKTSLFLSKTDLSDETQAYQDYSESKFIKIILDSKFFENSYFFDSRFQRTILFNCVFSNGTLYQTIFRHGVYNKTTFENSIAIRADFTGSKLNGSKFKFSNFNHSLFCQTKMIGIKIDHSSFIGADFESANLSHTVLENFPKSYFNILKNSKNKKKLLINLLKNYVSSIENKKFKLLVNFFPENLLLNLAKKIIADLSAEKSKFSLQILWQDIQKSITLNKSLIKDELIQYVQFYSITSGDSDSYDVISKFRQQHLHSQQPTGICSTF